MLLVINIYYMVIWLYSCFGYLILICFFSLLFFGYCYKSLNKLTSENQFGYLMSPATTPTERHTKQGWHNIHTKHVTLLSKIKRSSVILIGDSIVNGLRRYDNVWKNFKHYNTLNYGISGDQNSARVMAN